MSDSKSLTESAQGESDIIEFVSDEMQSFSSGVMLADELPLQISAVSDDKAIDTEAKTVQTSQENEADDQSERSQVFKLLGEPSLPELERENRARLSMQTPNRLFFYWSTGANPFQTLGRALRDQAANYSLVLKMTDLKRDVEQIHPIDPEGSRWFDVEADGEYRAEIGFYSPSRPYVRIIYSNVVETPRKTPSPRVASGTEWRVSSERFAKVLNVAGFKRDAFEVALAGDEPTSANAIARQAFTGLIGGDAHGADDVLPDEIRYAMFALAAGTALESLKFRIGARLFAMLQANADKLDAANALKAVQENFGVEAGEELDEEEELSAVYGSSRVNFARRPRRRLVLPRKYEPVSSHSFIS